MSHRTTSLIGQRALVTGASSNLGANFAALLAASDASRCMTGSVLAVNGGHLVDTL